MEVYAKETSFRVRLPARGSLLGECAIMAFARDYSVGIERKVKKDEEYTWVRLPALDGPMMVPE